MRARAAGVALAALLAGATNAGAEDNTREIDAGRMAAEIWCIQCHVIGKENQPQALAGPPSFVSLAQSGLSEGQLALALFNPHPPMPQFNLSRTDVRSLAAYIGSLKD